MSEIQRLRDDVLELDRQVRDLRARQQQRAAGDFVRANAIVGVIPSANVPAHGSIGLWTNQSGGALGIGAVVIQNGDRQFDTTAAVDDLDVVGVLIEAIANTAEGRLRHQGYHPDVIVEGAVVAGQFLRTSTTAGAAEDAGTIPTEGVFGMALTAAAGPGAGTVAAYLFGTIGALTADSVYLPRVSGSTYDDVEDANTLFGSAGWFSGGVISDAGGGNIDVTAGTGVLRSAASATAQLLFIDWGASAGNAIPVGTTRYIGVEWNMGVPQVTVRATDNFNHFTDWELGIVVREPAADGGAIHPQQHEHHAGDAIHTVIERWHQTEHIRRDNELNGNILGESGDNNRNAEVSAGAYWVALDRFATSAFDSSGADTFDTYSAGGREAAGVSVWPNLQYDNGGVLANLGGNKWANLWWYQELNGSIVMIYGTAQYNTEAMAGEEALPTTVPDRVSIHGTPIGRYIFQNGDTIPSQVQTIFIDMFNIAGVTDHGGLDGLLDDDHTIYLLADGTRALSGDWAAGAFSITADNVTIKDGSIELHHGTDTIAGDEIVAPTGGYIIAAAQAGVADDLDGIGGGANGRVIVVRADAGDTITVRHNSAGGGAGRKILLNNNADLVLVGNDEDSLTLLYDESLDGGNGAWFEIGRAETSTAGGHAILDGVIHIDSVADGVTRGSLIAGNATPKWDELTIGAAGRVLRSDGSDPVWTAPGIADDAILEVDGAPNATEYARFTANGLEGRTYAEVLTDLGSENFPAWADTGITGAELETLSDTSDADALHAHTNHGVTHVGAHAILDGSVHTDSVADGVTAGSIIIGNDTPKWDELVIAVPAANILNVLGIANGETTPSWKATHDGVNPADIAQAASPGTSLISAHRDHIHDHPDLAADLHTVYFLADGSRAMSGDIDLDGNNIDDGGVIFLREQANADADVGNQGQLWVKTGAPNEFMFTDDGGADRTIAYAGGAFHDGFSDHVVNEHIDHTGVTLTAGAGITGGGDISANREFALDDHDHTGDAGDGGQIAGATALSDLGIADNDIVQIDHAAVADDDYAKFTANGLEGRSYAEVLADLSAQATAAFDFNDQNVIVDSLYLEEKAAANADVIAQGQLWVKNDAPNTLWFTNDDGDDIQLGLGAAHALLDGSIHNDTVADAVTAGSIVIGNDTPKWDELVISVPAANVRNVLGIDNGETTPSWKALLDGVNPADIAAAASPGTSLIAAHRDHVHDHPDIAADLHTVYFLADGSRAMSGDIDMDGNNLDDGGVIFLREQAAADADVPGQGQIWVKSGAPNTLYFTDEDGTDVQLGAGGITPIGTMWLMPQVADGTATVAGLPTGDYPVGTIGAAAADGTLGVSLTVPNDFSSLASMKVRFYSFGGVNAVLRYSVATIWANEGEIYNTSTDSIAEGNVTINTATNGEMMALDISAAFTGIAAGDGVGILFKRHGAHVDDTVTNCYVLGFEFRWNR